MGGRLAYMAGLLTKYVITCESLDAEMAVSAVSNLSYALRDENGVAPGARFSEKKEKAAM